MGEFLIGFRNSGMNPWCCHIIRSARLRELQGRQREIAEEEERLSALELHKGKKEAYVKYLRGQLIVNKKPAPPHAQPSQTSVATEPPGAQHYRAPVPPAAVPAEPGTTKRAAAFPSCWEPLAEAPPCLPVPTVPVRDLSPGPTRSRGCSLERPRAAEEAETRPRGAEADSLEDARCA
jgi:hypothetical protein